MSEEQGKALVALSGGVDSSLVASLLMEDGWQVEAVTFIMVPGPVGHSEAEDQTCRRAGQVAAALGIPHHCVDVSVRFQEQVLAPCWQEYDQGRTPNPCVLCNERIKFSLLLDEAERMDASIVATGHHARLSVDQEGRLHLLRGADRAKDQSYFLYRLLDSPLLGTRLEGVRFPVGHMTKEEVRREAAARRLPSAEARESQDVCFSAVGLAASMGSVSVLESVAEQGNQPSPKGQDDGGTSLPTNRTSVVLTRSFAESLRTLLGAKARPGRIIDGQGKVLGNHPGVHHFTIGQRRGLSVASSQGRLYVTGIDVSRSDVRVGPVEELFSDGLDAVAARWMGGEPRLGRVLVQVRYRHKAVWGTVMVGAQEGVVAVRFDEPQRAVTPGQSVVFYDDDEVVGGAMITRAWSEA